MDEYEIFVDGFHDTVFAKEHSVLERSHPLEAVEFVGEARLRLTSMENLITALRVRRQRGGTDGVSLVLIP